MSERNTNKSIKHDEWFKILCIKSIEIYIYIYMYVCICIHVCMGFPGDSDGKESAFNVGDLSSIPGLGRSPGGGNGNPLQCSCL